MKAPEPNKTNQRLRLDAVHFSHLRHLHCLRRRWRQGGQDGWGRDLGRGSGGDEGPAQAGQASVDDAVENDGVFDGKIHGKTMFFSIE